MPEGVYNGLKSKAKCLLMLLKVQLQAHLGMHSPDLSIDINIT